MKTLKKSFILLTFSTLIFSSCLNDEYNDIKNNTFFGFDFKTTQSVDIRISTLDPTNTPMQGVKISVFSENPLNLDGTLKSGITSKTIFTGASNTEGKLICRINLATTVDSLYFLTEQIGFLSLKSVKTNENINLTLGGAQSGSQNARSNVKALVASAIPTPKLVNGYYVLGNWSTSGVPNYMMTSDVVSSSLLADINTTLPENFELPKTHPEFFGTSDDGNIKLYEDGEVFVTFVHEGAGNTNTLMYYTYPTATPPANTGEITNKTIIFPNVSFAGSGGGLYSGNKVQLYYLDPTTGKYTNIFPKGTTVAWGLFSNGWSNYTVKTLDPKNMFYSNQAFNPESSSTYKKHNVIFHDSERNILLLGFEDLRRDGNSDNDFNDAVFYATTNPITAINPREYAPVIKKSDTDDDGVSDENDEYPTDPKRAFNNYYPSKDGFATLAFEDLWPAKGDYDFNDLVIDYNYKYVTNGYNEVVSVDAKYKVKAVGASKANGFGVEFNTLPSNIINLTGQKFTENKLGLAANGVENNQSKAVVMVFDNALKVMEHKGTQAGINTISGEEYVTPAIFNIHFELKTLTDTRSFGAAPFNPFIFVGGDRSKEVHLPNSAPTSLADVKLFGTYDDDSNVANSSYYISQKYLPWALNIPVQFDYPSEKQDITKTYLFFLNWANSKGSVYKDWYDKKDNYRNNNNIYPIK